MDRRQFICGLTLATLSLPLLAGDGHSICPICQGQLANSADLKDDLSRPSRNLEVWSRAADCLVVGDQGGQICTRCWYVFRDGAWTRSSERPDDFHHPLSYAISAFPMPGKNRVRGWAIYQQQLAGADGKDGVVESLSFWAVKSSKYVTAIRQHAKLHRVALEIEEHSSEPGEIYVVAEMGSAED